METGSLQQAPKPVNGGKALRGSADRLTPGAETVGRPGWSGRLVVERTLSAVLRWKRFVREHEQRLNVSHPPSTASCLPHTLHPFPN